MTGSAATVVPPDRPFSWRFTAPLFLGSALNPVNSSLIATALAPIAQALRVPVGRTTALVTVLYLATAVTQPTAGKAAAVFGPRRVFLTGIVLVGAGGLLGGTAQSLVTLVISRLLIGIGTSCAYPTAMMLIRQRATVAGLDRPPGGVLGGLQLAGIGGFAGAMTTLLLFLFGLPTAHWWLLALSLLLWVAEIGWELRHPTPFLDLRLLVRNRALTATYLRFGIVMFCVAVVLYGLTQWLQLARGTSESTAGLLLLPMTLVGGIVIVPIVRRNLVRAPLLASCTACLIASAGLLLLDASTSLGWIIAVTVVFGVAMGTATSGNQTALYGQAPGEQLGTASGLMRTFGYVGSVAATALTGVVYHTHVTDHGLHRLGLVMTGTSLVLVALTLVGLARRPAPAD